MTHWPPATAGDDSGDTTNWPQGPSGTPADDASRVGFGVSPETVVDEAQRRAEAIIGEAMAEAERIRAEARQEAQILVSELGAQLADMGDAYRRAIQEARDTVHHMADRVRRAIDANPEPT